MNDLKFAFRQLAKNPGFTAVALLTLALGIGANTAIFSVVNALILRPLPFPAAERLVVVREVSAGKDQDAWGAHFLDWQAHSETLESVAAFDDGTMTLTGAGEAEFVNVGKVSAGLVPMFGAQPIALGRNFSATEDKPGGSRVAILSHNFWQRRYKGEPDIIGRSIILNDVSYTV